MRNPFEYFTLGSLGVVLILLLIGIAIFLIIRWRNGEPLLPSFSFSAIAPGRRKKIKHNKNTQGKENPDDNSIFCINIYPDKFVGEFMLKTAVAKDADIWEIGNKKALLQMRSDKLYAKLSLPDDIIYPPERLARMIGCEPLRRLKGLKFKWYQHLAPFAPVVALLIVFLLWVVIKGD